MMIDISHLLGAELDAHQRKVLNIRSKNINFREEVKLNKDKIEILYDAYHMGLPRHILNLRGSASIISKYKYHWYDNKLESFRKLVRRFEKCNNEMEITQQKLQSEFHWYFDISNEYDVPDEILFLLAQCELIEQESLELQLKIYKLRDKIFYIH